VNLAILGGSTPFTVPLIDELTELAPGRLALHGRDTAALEAVRAYAAATLVPRGWHVIGTTSLDQALEACEVVVHQIRYGGLAGRAEDEQLARSLGVPADETLGPAGLQAALRAAPALRLTAAEIVRCSPNALVLNLSNPLSQTTAIFAAAGLRVWGLCELPTLTADRLAAGLGATASRLGWSYTGLNHRGFLHDFTFDGERLPLNFADAAAHLEVTSVEIASTGAVPLKYFGLFDGRAPHGIGRAAQLETIRAAALAELTAVPDARPDALSRRDMPWYSTIVGPVLRAIETAEPLTTVLNLPVEDGLVRERRVVVGGPDFVDLAGQAPPELSRRWLDIFDCHERAALAAVADPSAVTLAAALEADPLMSAADCAKATRLLMRAL
jgi:6-phospho-beta-glucosidase